MRLNFSCGPVPIQLCDTFLKTRETTHTVVPRFKFKVERASGGSEVVSVVGARPVSNGQIMFSSDFCCGEKDERNQWQHMNTTCATPNFGNSLIDSYLSSGQDKTKPNSPRRKPSLINGTTVSILHTIVNTLFIDTIPSTSTTRRSWSTF